MSSQYRTVAAGLGVGAICIMMASLKWQHLLMFFAVAGVSWAVWSWFKSAGHVRPAAAEPRRPASRRKGKTRDNVYQIRTGQWHVSDAAGS